MGTILQIPDPAAIEAEACAWISQLDGSDPSPQDLAALREWMSRSPAHREAIENLSDLWNHLNVLTELAVPRPGRPRARPWDTIRSFLRRAAGPVPAAVAACLLLAAVVLVTWQWRERGESALTVPGGPSIASDSTQFESYVTKVGHQQTVDLVDGSRITLNTDSKVEVDIRADRRDVRLVKGEAMFEVVHDPTRPFQVYAGNGRVRALGTAFTVYLKDPDNVSVTVTAGEVELAVMSAPKAKRRSSANQYTPTAPLAEIKAGQSANFGLAIQSIETLEAAELSRQLAWRDGMLMFDGERLSEAVREIGRYTTQEIVILDPALSDLRIGGQFKIGETEAMFEALESSFGVQVDRINENLVQLSARH